MEITELKSGSMLQDGKYRILRTLGQGGFGITYEAEQLSLGRKVAIKEFFMKEHCNRDAGTSHVSVPSTGSKELVGRFREKFLKEARMIADMDHEHIVRIYDVFEEHGTAYYVMEYLKRGSLASRIKEEGPMTEDAAKEYIVQIGSALQYLHGKGILHLDVKPANIMLDSGGRAKLIDFGISKHYDGAGQQTSSNPVGISKGYAPLEQYNQSDISKFTPATDIYALGATLYHLVSGKVPPDASEVMNNGIPHVLSISETMNSLLRKAMSPRLKDRPQDVVTFIKLLNGSGSCSEGNGCNGDGEDTVIEVQSGKEPSQKVSLERKRPSSGWLGIAAGIAAAALVALLLIWKPWVPNPDKNNIIPSDTTLVAVDTTQAQPVTAISRPEMPLSPERPEIQEKKGSVKICSTPKGAQIWIDGRNTGRSTDDLLEGLEVGSHSLRLVLDGYEPYTASLEIRTGRQDRSYVLKEKSAPAKPVVKASSNRINGHEYVDLGLSVKWATCNVGASSPGDYGSYFAWGETSPKSNYSWSTLKYCNDNTGDSFSKYNQNQGGTRDNRTRLEMSDDAARANWGGSWRMPTKSEMDELKEQCIWQWTTQNGHKGYKVTSRKNGSSIFFPAAGYRNGSSSFHVSSYGYYWSSSLDTNDSYNAYNIYSNNSNIDWSYSFRRFGLSVRPVIE